METPSQTGMIKPEKRELSSNERTRRLLTTVLWAAVVVVALLFLRLGRDILIPFTLAVIAVYLVKVVARWAQLLRIRGRSLPDAAALVVAFAAIGLLAYGLFNITANNARAVALKAPTYQARLLAVEANLAAKFKLKNVSFIRDNLRDVNIGTLLGSVATSLTTMLGKSSLVLLFAVFLMVEIRFLPAKFNGLFPEVEQRANVEMLLKRIDRDIQTYLGVKTFVSVLTAVLSYAVMRFAGLDFAEFWALLIFILNYIPTFGSLVATIIPALVALLQYDGFAVFLIVLISLTAIQQFIGSFLDPSLMGQSLNLSPLVVVISLVLWGSLWGVVGMFLCVPMTVVLMIILSNFESSKWVALLLSKNGRIVME